MLQGIWLVIELGQEIMPTNNITKFDDDPLKNIQVKEWTRFILANLANSRVITPKCFMGSGWLPNFLSTNIFTKWWLYNEAEWNYWSYWADKCTGCRPPTFRPPSARVPILYPFFFKRAYKNSTSISSPYMNYPSWLQWICIHYITKQPIFII
mgnify:CR=1 FL=1